MENEDKKPVPGAGDSPAEDTEKEPETIEPSDSEDADFEKELEILEGKKPKPARTELDKAVFTAKSTIKRIKELGGNPADLIEEEEAPVEEQEKPAFDTSNFVTKQDLARTEVQKLSKTPNEFKLTMWYIENKGMSVEDAHFMANKNRIKKIVGEINRGKDTIPASPNGGAGSARELKTDAPVLPEQEKQRLIQSGMVYNPETKAYVGKKIQHRYDATSKVWVTERVPQKQ